MSIEVLLICSLLTSVLGGIWFARINNKKKNQRLIRERLELAFSEGEEDNSPVSIRKEKEIGTKGSERSVQNLSNQDV